MGTMPARPCRLFLFDLDGTLIDSEADLAHSANLALGRAGLRPLQETRIAEFIGDGMRKLIERALRESIGSAPDAALIDGVMALYQEEYEHHLLDRTRLYPGVVEALDRVAWAKCAVVSNKPEHFSRLILDGLGIADRFCMILGEDSTRSRKPDPTALLKVIHSLNIAPAETVMVGDSPADILAGKAAGTMTCGVLWGFRSKEQLQAAGCELFIGTMPELSNHFHPPQSERHSQGDNR
jgi:phosphoglycolate phosphatase